MTDYTENLRLPTVDPGITNWDAEQTSVHEAIDDIGNLFTAVIPSLFLPEAGVTFYDGLTFQEDVTVTKVSIYAQTAPTGADLIVDLLKGGAAQTKLATLTDGSNYELTDIDDLDFDSGQRMGLKFTQIGSTVEGDGVLVNVHYKKRKLS